MQKHFITLAVAVTFLFAANAKADLMTTGGTWETSDVAELFQITIAGPASNLYITNVRSSVLSVDVYTDYWAPGYNPQGGSGAGQILKDTNSAGWASSSFTNDNGFTVSLNEGQRRLNWNFWGTRADVHYPYTLSIDAPETWMFDSVSIEFSSYTEATSDFNNGSGWGKLDLDFNNWETSFMTWAEGAGAFGILGDNFPHNRWLDFTITFNGARLIWVENDSNGGHPIPEPGTLAVLGLGLAGLGVARRRMKK